MIYRYWPVILLAIHELVYELSLYLCLLLQFCLMWVLKFNFSSKCIPRCFWHEVWATGASLKKIVGWLLTLCFCKKKWLLVLIWLYQGWITSSNWKPILIFFWGSHLVNLQILLHYILLEIMYHQQIILLMISNSQEDHWCRLGKVMVPVSNLEEHQLILVPIWNTDHYKYNSLLSII